jgi:hypothetical protein
MSADRIGIAAETFEELHLTEPCDRDQGFGQLFILPLTKMLPSHVSMKYYLLPALPDEAGDSSGTNGRKVPSERQSNQRSYILTMGFTS